MVMADQTRDTVQPNTDAPMKFRQLHQVQTQGGFETSIVFANHVKVSATHGTLTQELPNVVRDFWRCLFVATV